MGFSELMVLGSPAKSGLFFDMLTIVMTHDEDVRFYDYDMMIMAGTGIPKLKHQEEKNVDILLTLSSISPIRKMI